ncbi:MAG: Gfo/Idh/MocA family oxidoreductase [Chloroflexi bacterium]|nr:Gfo/Idh/MocA family oxidoreductase [Chloroflexota bacterium]
MPKTLRAAVIGAGGIAVHGHIPGYRSVPDVEVAAVCDTNFERARQVARDMGIPNAYPDAASMLAAVKPDLGSVCVPNVFHKPMTITALQAGAHVLCEKPMALHYADALDMVQAAKTAGRSLTVGHHTRFYPPAAAMYDYIASGKLGELYYVKASYLRRSGIPGYGSWFTNKDLAGGGAMLDIGCHILDLALWFLGHPRPLTVSASTFAKFGPRAKGLGGWGADHFPAGARFDVDDLATAFVRFENGVTMTIDASWAGHGTDGQRLQIFGTEGGVELNDKAFGKELPVHYFAEAADALTEEPVPYQALPGSSYDHEIAAWVEGIRNGRPPLITGEQGAAVVQIIEAMYLSAAAGKEVRL